jgi:HEAT repeat protein
LKKAIAHRLISDPALQVPKRAMDVLATIGTPKAIEVLRECLTSPSDIIREEAEILLESIT